MKTNFIVIYFPDIDFWSEIKFAANIISQNIDSETLKPDDMFKAVVKLASGYHFVKTMKSTLHQSADHEEYIAKWLKIEYMEKPPETNYSYDVQEIVDCNTQYVYNPII